MKMLENRITTDDNFDNECSVNALCIFFKKSVKKNEHRLDQELSELCCLEKTINRVDSIHKKIVTHSQSLEKYLTSFSNSMEPIYLTTKEKVVKYENMIKISREYQSLARCIHLADKVKVSESASNELLRLGINCDILTHLTFLDDIAGAKNRLTKASKQFCESSIDKLAVFHVASVETLLELFRRWLSLSFKETCNANEKSDFKDQCSEFVHQIVSPPVFPEENIRNLMILAAWLKNVHERYDISCNPHATYVEFKIDYMAHLLTPLSACAKTGEKKYSTAFVRLMQSFIVLAEAELKVMKAILGSEVEEAWAKIIETAVDLIVLTGEKVLQHIQEKTDFFFTIKLFEIVDYWIMNCDSFQNVLPKEKDFTTRLNNMFEKWISATSAMFHSFLLLAENLQPPELLPQDASTTSLTRNMMAFLKNILAYPAVTESFLTTIGEENWKKSDIQVTEFIYVKSKFDLSKKYIEIAMSSLENNITIMSNEYSQALQGNLFMLNNFNHIYKTMKCVINFEAVFLARLEKIVEKLIVDFEGIAITPLCSHIIMAMGTENISKDGLNLKSSARKNVKKKLIEFNENVDDLATLCEHTSVEDADIQQKLIMAVQKTIIPLYTRFYDRFSKTSFSKKKENYLIFSPELLLREFAKSISKNPNSQPDVKVKKLK